MKFVSIVFILAFYIGNSIFSQTELQKKYLIQYGQVWSMLKYFHPKPSLMNWDAVLLSDFDKVHKCQSNDSFNLVISTLIQRCRDYELNPRKIYSASLFNQSFDFLGKNTF